MKIAIVVSGPFVANGVCRVAESWARMLVQAGHEVAVAAEQGGAPVPVPGVETQAYSSAAEASRLVRARRRRSRAVEALRALDGRGALDLVLSHDPRVSAGVRRAFPHVPLLQTFHSPAVDEDRLNNWKYAGSAARRLSYPATFAASWWADREALRAIDCAHTLSEFTWRRLSQRYPEQCRARRWQRVPGTFDDASFRLPGDRAAVRRQLGLDEDELVLLTVRRLVPRNGVDRVLACARVVADGPRRLRFVIGGTGPLESALRREIEAHGLAGRVELLGFVPDDALPSYYQAADALLVPTRDLECFGLPVVEGMACGATPLVVPEGGPPELVPHAGCVAEANSTAAFAALVGRFAAGGVQVPADELAATARAHFSETAVAPAVWALVEEVAGARR
ncbi:MAG: glycosyltransferase family 4 protein [Myxococcota bacterium]|nr:glycosyltransferase family 4 protein [Myxococcota bacterium]